MLAILTALALSQATFRPLGDCSLVRPVEFFEDISALPEGVRLDIKKRRKLFYSRTEKGVTFSDVIGPNDKVGPQLLYVARHKEQWLISYMYGGVAIRVVTVSYLQSESSETPYLMGALEGDGCKAANAFLDGLSVEQDWQR